MTSHRPAVAILFAVLLLTPPADGAPDPGAPCQAKKLRASAVGARRLLRCHARAANHGDAADTTQQCRDAAATRLAGAFARIEARGGCIATGDFGLVRADIGNFVADAFVLLRPAITPSGCAADKFYATGRAASAWLRAFARNKLDPDEDRLSSDVAAASLALQTAFSAAESQPPCLTTGDVSAIQSAVFGSAQIPPFGVLRVVARLTPSCGDGVASSTEVCDAPEPGECTGTCTPECTCVSCGDGEVNQPGEECDGADAGACPSLCGPDCTCPVCGNNVREAGEECDGADAGACPSLLCGLDCTCPPPVCGNGVRETGEQCDGTELACPVFLSYHTCVPPGDPLGCTCCGLQYAHCVSTSGRGGCCPGHECVPTGGPGIEGTCWPDDSCRPRGMVCSLGTCCPGLVCMPPYPGYPYAFCCSPSGGACSSNGHCCSGVCASGTCS